ncbi:hypothetical protein [Butyrivibrio fibrisolvens]|nr:hypothetical protein [Butyrivibrio fibrisolvens]
MGVDEFKRVDMEGMVHFAYKNEGDINLVIKTEWSVFNIFIIVVDKNNIIAA